MLSLITPIARSCRPQGMHLTGIRYAGKKCAVGGKRSGTGNPGLDKIRRLQAHFQKEDGKPIHLKGGHIDNLLYRSTWALCFLGLFGQIQLYAHYILY